MMIRFPALIVTCTITGCTPPPLEQPPPTMIPALSPETRTHAAGWGDRSWLEQHQDGCRFMRDNDVYLLLLGDSITQGFGGGGRSTSQPGSAAIREALPGMVIANQGISGDRTQHVLWRLDNDALAGACPKFIAIMIGTNNLPDDTSSDISRGIELIVSRLSDACPDSIILLHAVPPRGTDPMDSMRERVINTNRRIQALGELPHVTWVDPWGAFFNEDGTFHPDRMSADGVHFAPGGYKIWASTLKQHMDQANR